MKIVLQWMPLFWAFAEGLILIALRWGYCILGGEKSRQIPFSMGFLLFFLFLVFLRFYGEAFFSHIMDFENPAILLFYKRAVWNFFCTIWVILEGIIMVYVVKIFRILKPYLEGRLSKNREHGTRPLYVIVFLTLSLLGFYVLYECQVLWLKSRYGLNLAQMNSISLFYIRICGVFWIIFEWVVAVAGIRTYLMLHKGGHEP
jgi:hypothetical protein